MVSLNADGDVLMADLLSLESPKLVFRISSLTQNGREVLFHPDRCSGPAYVEPSLMC